MFSQKSNFPPLLRLTYLLQQKSDEALSKVGVSLSHAHIMSGLSSAVPVTQHQLAVILSQTESNVSRQLAAMQKQGLVSVTKNKKDARARDVKLTAKGVRKYKLAQSVLKNELSKLQRLDSAKDRKTVEQVVTNLLASLKADAVIKRQLHK